MSCYAYTYRSTVPTSTAAVKVLNVHNEIWFNEQPVRLIFAFLLTTRGRLITRDKTNVDVDEEPDFLCHFQGSSWSEVSTILGPYTDTAKVVNVCNELRLNKIQVRQSYTSLLMVQKD